MATPEAAWHMNRRRRILAKHPKLRQLFQPDPTTALWAATAVVLQLGLAIWVQGQSWWVLVILAYTVGAVIAHALGVLIHEAGHDLVFRRPSWNRLLAIFVNIPLGAPAAMEFRRQHMLHHQHLGDGTTIDGKDTQSPVPAEVEWTGASSWRKVASFTFGRFFYAGRPANKVPFDRWMLLNWVLVIGSMILLVVLSGWRSFCFLGIASLAAFGPHPTGARRFSEHLAMRPGQPTTSYYGMLNWFSFNVGYHVEHHDFPLVPWTKMKQLRQAEPAAYDRLYFVRSWTTLLLHYFFDERYRVGHYTGLGSYIGEDATSAVETEPHTTR